MGTMTFGGRDVFGNLGNTDVAGARRQIGICLDAGVNLTLDTLVRSGKVRYLGASNLTGWQIMKALAVADAGGYQRFVSNQIYYSLESRDAEYEQVPVSVDQGLGVMVWSPLAGGLLSGKYRRGQRAGDGRHLTDWRDPPVRDEDKLYDIIEVVVSIAASHGVSPAQVSLAYLLAKPGVTSLVIGARKDEQLADNLGAADVHLAADDIDRLDKISAPALICPHWHQAQLVSSRFSEADLAWYRPTR